MKSIFTFSAYMVFAVLILFTGFFFYLVAEFVPLLVDFSTVGLFAILVFFLGGFIYLLFGELKSKAILVSIDQNSITTSAFLGLGAQKHFDLKTFDGYTTTLLPSRSGYYEYLYLMKDGKKQVKLSAFYHKNYEDLKKAIARRSTFLGNKPFDMRSELKELFS